MKLLCASGIHNIFYINDYNNDPLVEYFFTKSSVETIRKI